MGVSWVSLLIARLYTWLQSSLGQAPGWLAERTQINGWKPQTPNREPYWLWKHISARRTDCFSLPRKPDWLRGKEVHKAWSSASQRQSAVCLEVDVAFPYHHDGALCGSRILTGSPGIPNPLVCTLPYPRTVNIRDFSHVIKYVLWHINLKIGRFPWGPWFNLPNPLKTETFLWLVTEEKPKKWEVRGIWWGILLCETVRKPVRRPRARASRNI